MNREEARRVLALRDSYATWKTPADSALMGDRAAVLAQALPTAPVTWAMAYIADHTARYGDAPTDGQIIAGWRQSRVPADVQARIDAPAPQPPRVVAEDTNLSLRWNRARVAALIDGATVDESIAAANRALGVEPDPEPVGIDVAALVADLRAQVGSLSRLRMPDSDAQDGVA